MSDAPKFPHAETVIIVGQPNAFEILGNVQGALRRAGAPKSEIEAFLAEVTSGSYEDLCATAEEYVPVEWV